MQTEARSDRAEESSGVLRASNGTPWIFGKRARIIR